MTNTAIQLNPRVLWRRVGTVGHVSIYHESMDEKEAARLCAAVVAHVADKWVTLPVPSTIMIRQPAPKWCAAGAEREMIDNKLKTVRDIAKAVLRDAGYTVR